MSERPAAVLFDALGTLIRLEPPGPRLRRSLLGRHGVEVGADRAESAMRAEMHHYVTHCVRARDDASLAVLRLECADVLADALAAGLTGPDLLPCLTDAIAFALFDDALPALDALRAADVRLAIVSNWDVSLLRTLERLRIADRFEAVVHSAAVGASKPSPRPFAVALERLELEPGQALHVGDDEVNDRQGARAAGVPVVLVTRHGRPREGDLGSLAELPALLGDRGVTPAVGLRPELRMRPLHLLIAFVAWFLSTQVFGGLALALHGDVPTSHYVFDPYVAGSLAASDAVLIAAVVWAARHAPDWRAALGLVRPPAWGRALGLAVAAIVVAQVIGQLLEPLLHGAESQGLKPPPVPGTTQAHIGVAVAAVAFVLAAPIGEELFFRGALFATFRLRLGAVWMPVVSGLVFGAAHLEPRAFPELAVFGLFLALLYEATGSVLPGMIAHACFNLLALLVGFLGA